MKRGIVWFVTFRVGDVERVKKIRNQKILWLWKQCHKISKLSKMKCVTRSCSDCNPMTLMMMQVPWSASKMQPSGLSIASNSTVGWGWTLKQSQKFPSSLLEYMNDWVLTWYFFLENSQKFASTWSIGYYLETSLRGNDITSVFLVLLMIRNPAANLLTLLTAPKKVSLVITWTGGPDCSSLSCQSFCHQERREGVNGMYCSVLVARDSQEAMESELECGMKSFESGWC